MNKHFHTGIMLVMVAVGTYWVARAAIVAKQQTVPAGQPASPPRVQQPSEIELSISGDPGTPPRFAVPDFVALSPDAGDIAKTVTEVLWDDLNFEREFYLIPRDTYSTVPVARSPEQIPFNAWRELGADGLIFGAVQKTGNRSEERRVGKECRL